MLVNLHWFCLEQQIQYKLLLHSFRALNGPLPWYLQETVKHYTFGRSQPSGNSLFMVQSRLDYAVMCTFVCLFGNFTFHSRMFHSFADVRWKAANFGHRRFDTFKNLPFYHCLPRFFLTLTLMDNRAVLYVNISSHFKLYVSSWAFFKLHFQAVVLGNLRVPCP